MAFYISSQTIVLDVFFLLSHWFYSYNKIIITCFYYQFSTMIHIGLVSVCEWWFCFEFQTDVHMKVQPADKAMACDPYYIFFFVILKHCKWL